MDSFADTRLDTPRLNLRPLLPGDAPAVWQIFSDAEVMRYWSTPPWTRPEEAEGLIERDRVAMASVQYLRLALLGFAFGPLQLNRVEADVDPRNIGSMRTVQRLGFQQEGLLRERWIVAGEVSDTALFGLLQRDFRPAGQAARLPG